MAYNPFKGLDHSFLLRTWNSSYLYTRFIVPVTMTFVTHKTGDNFLSPTQCKPGEDRFPLQGFVSNILTVASAYVIEGVKQLNWMC